MEYFVLAIVMLVVGLTSKDLGWRAIGQVLGFGGVSFFVSTFVLSQSCWNYKLLPYSFCGELTGLLNVLVTSVLVGIVVAIGTAVYHFKKVKITVRKR